MVVKRSLERPHLSQGLVMILDNGDRTVAHRRETGHCRGQARAEFESIVYTDRRTQVHSQLNLGTFKTIPYPLEEPNSDVSVVLSALLFETILIVLPDLMGDPLLRRGW